MIIRAVSSYDVAENEALVSRLKYFYDIIDSSVKPTTGPFSWVPGLAMAQKIWASMSIYRVFNKAVHERKLSGIKRNDTLQQLLDAGESLQCTLGVRFHCIPPPSFFFALLFIFILFFAPLN